MDSKQAERGQSNEAPAMAVLMKDGMEGATRVIPCDDATLKTAYWANVKSKVRSFGEYAVLRTRQGISMFGEPKLESLVKGTDAKDASQ